jgi:hypothetical protein
MIAVSSANVAVSVLSISGTSAVNIRYKRGPSTLPCGTPARIAGTFDSVYHQCLIYMELKYNFIQISEM